MRSNLYQYTLIALGVVATAFFGVFFYREIFPEYKIYQDDYIALEEFRSTYTLEPPPHFAVGVKQILLEKSDKGNPVIDRCTSCHVALQLPHFSSTKIAKDINGTILVDADGKPVLVPNDEYVWKKVDNRIADLEDAAVIESLEKEGRNREIAAMGKEAAHLKSLKVADVGSETFDVTKVLSMHPLMGQETYPFQYHPVEEYGCTSCHSGNGRAVTTMRAHGPVFDETYEKEFIGYVPEFTEIDKANDPRFAKMFNGRPSEELLFQTSPILAGEVIQAKCAACHTSSKDALKNAKGNIERFQTRQSTHDSRLQQSFESDKQAIIALMRLSSELKNNGTDQVLKSLEKRKENYTLTPEDRRHATAQWKFISTGMPEKQIQDSEEQLIGSEALVEALRAKFWVSNGDKDEKEAQNSNSPNEILTTFLNDNQDKNGATGVLFAKFKALKSGFKHPEINAIDLAIPTEEIDKRSQGSEIDLLTYNYQRGQELFISQGCYACHRITGFSRGGVGPELTYSGDKDPWYIKQSIVWPQADLATSTMPNFGLDHEELQDLVTYLLGQRGENTKVHSSVGYKTSVMEWEAGRKEPFEKAISPIQINDVHYGMTVFATEGCASCHRLEGFDSHVGFAIEKNKPSFSELYAEKEWFKRLFPEEISGSAIVSTIDSHADEIDRRIIDDVHQGAILDKIESSNPQLLETFYTPFKFASRAKNDAYTKAIAAEKDLAKRHELEKSHDKWKARVHRLMLMFAETYGVGRLICPRPNWSGVYRSDEWLMEHFKNPAAHVPRSLMPVFPFDDSKFYALTHMLDMVGAANRDSTRAIWSNEGFNPAIAYQIHCSQCHGNSLLGNGPVVPWIYPIPKNLLNREFLRNLTREQAINSIAHGVKGTPMPPWGEVPEGKPFHDKTPVLTRREITKLVDWLFSSVSLGRESLRKENVPKWHYMPEDIIRELEDEGGLQKLRSQKPAAPLSMLTHTETSNFIASLTPVTSSSTSKVGIEEIFDQIPNTSSESDIVSATPTYTYNIKKEYYTPQNIAQGKHFFELNCASCHGKEADGSGYRAGSMSDAKPRILTNLDWINTRDDLRLLRSIKYGVPGTSMTPWGDLTNSLQRLQLVMFIRTLSEGRFRQDQLATVIYDTFNTAEITLETARINSYKALKADQEKYYNLRREREKLYGTLGSQDSSEKDISLYTEELKQLQVLRKSEENDAKYLTLKNLIKEEKELFQGIGFSFLQKGSQEDLDKYLSLLQLLQGRFEFKNDTLTYTFSNEKEASLETQGKELLAMLSKQIDALNDKQAILGGKISNADERERQQEIKGQIQALMLLKNELTSALSNGQRIREKELSSVKDINNNG